MQTSCAAPKIHVVTPAILLVHIYYQSAAKSVVRYLFSMPTTSLTLLPFSKHSSRRIRTAVAPMPMSAAKIGSPTL